MVNPNSGVVTQMAKPNGAQRLTASVHHVKDSIFLGNCQYQRTEEVAMRLFAEIPAHRSLCFAARVKAPGCFIADCKNFAIFPLLNR